MSTVVVVQVRVRLFAGLRERAGWSERELDGVECVGDVWARLELGEEPPGLLYAVNRAYAPPERELVDGDEVALIPPVSGGACRLSDEPLDPAAVIAEVADERAGGIAVFVGTTRVHSRGRTVLHLDYEAYEGMAEQVMEELAADLEADVRALCGRDRAPRRPCRDRRAFRRDRRLGPAPRRRARCLQGLHRPPQGDRAAVEEGVLRGRRGMDRTRFLTQRASQPARVEPDSLRRSADYLPACNGKKEGARGGTMGSPTLTYEGGEEWIGRGS